MPKKKFIDRKNATTFVLTHRSQRDPLISDENAPQNILLPLDQVPTTAYGGQTSGGGAHRDDQPTGTVKKRKEEQSKYGIYFDDDYDYLQHLKDSKEVSNIEWDFCERIYAPSSSVHQGEDEPSSSSALTKEDLKEFKLKLPSSVFESNYKEDIGLLNKAAQSRGPRPDLDPDIIAALDEDFDFDNPDNELEDDFMQLANQEGVVTEKRHASDDEEGGSSDGDYEDEMADSVGSLPGPNQYFSDDDEAENKSRFTSYSMSSSVVRRNKQLLLVDDCFEKMYEGYDDTEIGALDCDEIEGHIDPDSALLLKYADEFEREQMKEKLVNERITELALKDDSSSASGESDSEEDEKKEKWDCESILSTYSNKKNLPRIISVPPKKNLIQVSTRTGIPVGELGKGLTRSGLKALDASYDEQPNHPKSMVSGATSIRPKTETPEERRERKQSVKEYRRERRVERKANTEAFKDEKKRMEKTRMNARHNAPALKL